MDMDYKPNSHKAKAEQKEKPVEKKKEIKKVIKGTVKTKKKSVLKDIFISEDANNVKSYVLMDVLVPAIKKAISDIVTDGIDMILYGETGRNRKRSNGSKVSYRSYYERKDDRDRRSSRDRDSRRSHDYDNVIVDTRLEALEVIEAMEDIIEEYGNVSVSDFYELVGIETDNFAYNKFGWTDLRNAEAVRVRDGYLIKLPRAISL